MAIGNVWIIDASRMWRIANALREFKAMANIKHAFKFSDLTKSKLDPAKQFVLEAIKHSDLIGLKTACSTPRRSREWRPRTCCIGSTTSWP